MIIVEKMIQKTEEDVILEPEEKVIREQEKKAIQKPEEKVICESEKSAIQKPEEKVIRESEKSAIQKPEEKAICESEKSAIQKQDLPTGKIRYPLINDYMFRAVMQTNRRALEGLLYALLRLEEGSITSIEIMNPIELGKTIDSKTCVLDLKIMFNNKKIINIELQVVAQDDWKERSLTYMAKSFDNVKRGEEYGTVIPCIHIGILDFSLSNLEPKLYSEYKLMDTKTHEIYSDIMSLYVINLNQAEDAKNDPELEGIYYWAKLFKCREWEEFKMLAEKNEYIQETVFTLREMTEEEKIREQCEARERYYRDWTSAVNTGRRKGKKDGERETAAMFNQLIQYLISQNRIDDLNRSTTDKEYQEKLIAEMMKSSKADE